MVDEAGAVLTNYSLRRSALMTDYCKPPPGLVRYVNVDVNKYDVNAPLSPAVPGVTVPPNAPSALASMIAWRSDPAPLSLMFVTLSVPPPRTSRTMTLCVEHPQVQQ